MMKMPIKSRADNDGIMSIAEFCNTNKSIWKSWKITSKINKQWRVGVSNAAVASWQKVPGHRFHEIFFP